MDRPARDGVVVAVVERVSPGHVINAVPGRQGLRVREVRAEVVPCHAVPACGQVIAHLINTHASVAGDTHRVPALGRARVLRYADESQGDHVRVRLPGERQHLVQRSAHGLS
jgi:hypothetical protein